MADLKAIPRSILDHILFRHPQGEGGGKFNVLQKLAYLVVLLILLPLMILTGLTMSPGMDAAVPGAAVGVRRAAVGADHPFPLCAFSLVIFFAIHIFEVFAAGVFNEMRSIITGRFAIKASRGAGAARPAKEPPNDRRLHRPALVRPRPGRRGRRGPVGLRQAQQLARM